MAAFFAGLALIILAVGVAHAEDDMGVWLPRAEAADLFSKAAELPRLHEKITTLEQALETEKRISEATARLVEIADKVAAGEQRLRELAEDERDVYKVRSERLEAQGEKGTRWLRCRANAGPVALVGVGVGSIFPGIGNLAGGALGAIVGCVAGLAGAP